MATHDIALIHNPRNITHAMPFPRPHLESFERPLRTQMAMRYLESSGTLDGFQIEKTPKAKLEDLLLVHSPYLINSVEIASEIGSGQLGEAAYASPELLRASLYAAGGVKRGVTGVLTGEVTHAFALVRPPGHHASTSNPMGLCYFNNVAIGTAIALQDKDVKRVSILDFDDHHGNGTSEIFYANPDVQFISIHEYDYDNYGTGHFMEMGWKDAIGTNVNIPLLENSPDKSYEDALEKIVSVAMKAFKPDIIMVSAGYDAHYGDPVGNMNVDTRTFWKIGAFVREMVTSIGARGSVWALEGGYNPFMLGPSIRASLDGLAGRPIPDLDDQIEREEYTSILESNGEIIAKVRQAFKEHW
ncbi:MAG: histone deacetylase family protein [Candidatus Thorarchaeota archaeon]